MIVKTKLYWNVFLILLEISNFIILYDEIFLKKSINLDTVILLFGGLIFFPIVIMISTTIEHIFTDKKIIMNWKITLGFKIFYKCRREAPYDQLFISDWTPYFTKLYILYVSGPNNFGAFFGLFHTKKKEVFLILSEYAKNAKMDEGARKILGKYKMKYKDKIDVKKLVKR